MKKVEFSPFNVIFFTSILITFIFTFIIVIRWDGNILFYLILYVIIILLNILYRIGALSTFEYGEKEIFITKYISSNTEKASYEKLESISFEDEYPRGTNILLKYNDGSKKRFGTTGCSLGELDEMVKYINKQIKMLEQQKE